MVSGQFGLLSSIGPHWLLSVLADGNLEPSPKSLGPMAMPSRANRARRAQLGASLTSQSLAGHTFPLCLFCPQNAVPSDATTCPLKACQQLARPLRGARIYAWAGSRANLVPHLQAQGQAALGCATRGVASGDSSAPWSHTEHMASS